MVSSLEKKIRLILSFVLGETFVVSDDRIIITDVDVRPVNDVEKLLTHRNYLFCWGARIVFTSLD
jgi:hypothetical protein